MEYYVIDKQRKTIVNCVNTDSIKRAREIFPENKYDLKSDPPDSMLEAYEYYHTRP